MATISWYDSFVLNLYRMHSKTCPKGYARLDRSGINCDCPVHVEGKVGSEYVRKSTGTCSMTRARKMTVEAEERGSWSSHIVISEESPKILSIQHVTSAFLDDCRSDKGRNLASPTLIKYVTLLKRLEAFCDKHGVASLPDITFEQLRAFRETWPTGPLATAHHINRLRTFYQFCVEHEWCQKNLAKQLKTPRGHVVEREPYTDLEMEEILEAARTIKLDPQQEATNFEIETFILTMRYSGIAISDCALLQTPELRGDEIRLYRKKMERHEKRVLVVVPIPLFVLERLRSLPLNHGKYFFCHGEPILAPAVEAWRKRLAMVFKHANIANAGSHRFRHTFAYDLLTKHVSIEIVSRFLGHSDIKTTIKHYSHFLEKRIQANSDVLRRLYSA